MPTVRVNVSPKMLRWARERAERTVEQMISRFTKYEAWEAGEAKPTLKQLQSFAKAVFVPIGYLFLSEPPEEELPIPDLRTIGNTPLARPSPNLLDTLYICERRQAWYREYAKGLGNEPLGFIGSARTSSSVKMVAEEMRQALGFDLEARRQFRTWEDALREFIRQTESCGILVMVSGVVNTNNKRKLDLEEFRGFAISDDLAPLVFINGNDTKSAQMFTLAHELAHLWLGKSALSDLRPDATTNQRIEQWCNRVAGEFLVPEAAFREHVPEASPLSEVKALAKRFKVSTLVILRRLLDVGSIARSVFEQAYRKEVAFLLNVRDTRKSGRGDFYLTQEVRSSRRFVRALVVSTLEGQTLYRDAFQLLGVSKEKTFREMGDRLGVPA